MMKKMLVLAGMAAMLLCGCGKETRSIEVTTEPVSVVEQKLEVIDEANDELISDVANMYIEAAKLVYGEDYDDTEATCSNEGVTYEGRFVSWEYLEEVAYNSMTNNF